MDSSECECMNKQQCRRQSYANCYYEVGVNRNGIEMKRPIQMRGRYAVPVRFKMQSAIIYGICIDAM